MAQLVVRRIEETVVTRLRRRAARHGVSLEEEHRRILRAATLPGGKAEMTFKEYLLVMPEGGDDDAFARPPAKPRRVRL